MDRIVIKKMRSEGKSLSEIGRVFGISRNRVWQIVNDKLGGRDQMREKARIRDGNKCCSCGSGPNGRKLDAHHLDPDERRTRKYDRDISRIVTLCHKCHCRLHAEMRGNSEPDVSVRLGIRCP